MLASAQGKRSVQDSNLPCGGGADQRRGSKKITQMGGGPATVKVFLCTKRHRWQNHLVKMERSLLPGTEQQKSRKEVSREGGGLTG